jgi:phage host-nuclease inhibitor protein Gam
MAEQLSEVMLEAYAAPEDEERRQQFRITDEGMADWAVRKIAKARQEFAEADQVADEQIQRIEDWRASKKRDLEHAEEFFGGLLRAYYYPQHEADPKRKKTFKLPNGQVQFRAQQPEYKRDDEALLGWLKANGRESYIVTKESPAWGELKKILKQHGEHMIDTESGEVVDGILVVERPTAIRIVTATEAEGEA